MPSVRVLLLVLAVPSAAAAQVGTESPFTTVNTSVTADVRVPELRWCTNVASITLENRDAHPHEVEIDVAARHTTLDVGGFQWQTTVTLGPREKRVVDRSFIIKPLPGHVQVRFTILDTTDGVGVLRVFSTEFGIRNARINPLTLPPRLLRGSKAKAEYSDLKMVERGHFVIYYLADDGFTASRLDAIAARRNAAYDEIVSSLNPTYDATIAVILFPDAESKTAHVRHQGWGWAPGGNTLVEIHNAQEHVDPNHELVHVITQSIGDPPALFGEGLAVFYQVDSRWDGWTVDDWSRSFLDAGLLIPLQTLLSRTEIGSPDSIPAVAYPEAGSFLKFLVSDYGLPKVTAAFGALERKDDFQTAGDNEKRIATIFGASVSALELKWHERLRSRKVSPVPQAKIDQIRMPTRPCP
jgi:hypothetical protein